jgi:hypothetical protein
VKDPREGNGVFIPTRCSVCGLPCLVESRWENCQRVPVTAPLCSFCQAQEVLF